AGHVRQGASTITQQLARNSFALKEKTYRRKLLEIFVAERIEQHFDKQKIMELYLNRIYFGGGLYGAEAAARGYFDKPAREMSLVECATLAGIIKSPNRLSPSSQWAAELRGGPGGDGSGEAGVQISDGGGAAEECGGCGCGGNESHGGAGGGHVFRA